MEDIIFSQLPPFLLFLTFIRVNNNLILDNRSSLSGGSVRRQPLQSIRAEMFFVNGQ